MINHKFISFSAVQIYDHSFIYLQNLRRFIVKLDRNTVHVFY